MQAREIAALLNSKYLLSQDEKPVLIETHISWVILAGSLAYKIKKPVRFSFLDFSSLEKRKFYCERELTLNRRLAPQMYLRVVPVHQNGQDIFFNTKNGLIVDYAVLMKRMDPAKEMDKLLKADQASATAIATLAKKVAAFHLKAAVILTEPDIETLKDKFNDLTAVLPLIDKYMDESFAAIIAEAVKIAGCFLDKYRPHIIERSAGGFVRDVHGDLHTGNIFLYADPVIFDCIEFNDAMRQIDILDEVAFLCMDLDAFDRQDLSNAFYRDYLGNIKSGQSKETDLLFRYYKCYRANVRAKVCLLKAKEAADPHIKAAATYLTLLKSYLPGLTPA